jgi:hypothetical protein
MRNSECGIRKKKTYRGAKGIRKTICEGASAEAEAPFFMGEDRRNSACGSLDQKRSSRFFGGSDVS